MHVTAIIADDRHTKGFEEVFERLPDGWAADAVQAVLDSFNSTLRTGELPRRLVRIVSVTPSPREHVWGKSNLVTIMGRGMSWDTMRCDGCGATGKRYGLGGRVTLDKKFDKAPYTTHCPGEGKR